MGLGDDRVEFAVGLAHCNPSTVDCGEVVDAPVLGWRGGMLDVSRHFLPKRALLRYVDLFAMHRLNRGLLDAAFPLALGLAAIAVSDATVNLSQATVLGALAVHRLAASDCILVLRSRSVGETNGPLLDALGAGRAVLATRTGSIPEVAGEAVRYCLGTERGIRTGLEELADGGVRSDLEWAATCRARELTWEASATERGALFHEVSRA